MTVEEMKAAWDAIDNDDEYLKFERVQHQLHRRPDIHAFIKLDRMLPKAEPNDIVAGAAHDEIWLDVDLEELAKVITHDDIIELSRCGVRLDLSYDSLAMFV